MKKFYSFLLTALVLGGTASAQRLDITLKDNSVVSYDCDKIQYMEVMPASEPGQLSGYWYLGYRLTSSASTHYDGTEKLSFNGTVLKWTKSSSEDIYDLTYADNFKSFKAVNRSTGTSYNYTIVTNEPELLVLKQGSISRYFYKSMTEAHDAELIKFPTRTEYTDTAKVWALKGGNTHSDATPMGNHYSKYAAATDEQITWLATASNEPDATFMGVDGYTTWTAKTINLYPLNGGNPTPADVNQHSIGDCCMCAVFASYAYQYPDFIKSIITKKSNTQYVVKMYDPMGNPIDVAVTNKLLCNSSGSCAQVSGKNGVFNWASIMEKALMKYLTCFKTRKNTSDTGTQSIGGIGTEIASPPFTGCGDSYSYDRDKLFNDEFNIVVDYALKNGLISVGGFGVGGLLCGTLETVTGHAFTVMYTSDPDNYRFTMRNPWGITAVDGKLEIPNKREILKTIDFRLVYPGAAAPYHKADLGAYTIPSYVMQDADMYLSPELLKMYNLKSYGPVREIEEFDTPDEEDIAE